MRILVISNLYPPAHLGGYEMLCAETVERLAERHEISVLTSDHGNAPSEPGIVRELAYLPEGRRQVLRAPLASLRAVRVTRRVLEEFRPELVFVWNGSAMPQAAIRVAEQSGAAVAYSVNEYWFSGLYERDRYMRYFNETRGGLYGLWGRATRAFNRHPELRLDTSTRVPASICWASESLRQKTGLPPSIEALDERVIHSAVHDSELFTSLPREPATDPPLILFVGRVEKQKGPDVAYRALAALRDRHGIDARLVLAGFIEPSMGETLAPLARELRIEDRVEQLGQVPQSRLGELLTKACALVVPSTWEEPLGLVNLEGALARVPVVASRSGGMTETLLEDEHALYFPIGDHDACADQLARVLGEPAETAARAGRAFERAQLFTFDRYMTQMHEFVDAAGQHQPAGAVGATA